MDNKQVSDTWERGNLYEWYVGRWSRQVAPPFLSWLSIPAGRRWLDVGCGTGALSEAIVDRCAPASVTGVEPSEGFLKTARENLAGRVAFHQGLATAIPLGGESVDVVVSGLVLNFVPDQRAALAEMARVTGKGGTIAAYVWDYAGKMELMRYFWDAAVELDPSAAKLDEGPRFPLCRPQVLEKLFVSDDQPLLLRGPHRQGARWGHRAGYSDDLWGHQPRPLTCQRPIRHTVTATQLTLHNALLTTAALARSRN